MGAIPFLRPWFNRQFKRRGVSPRDVLQLADVDLCNPLEDALRRLLNKAAEQVPVLAQRQERQTADGDVCPNKKTWRQADAVPLVRAHRANDVFCRFYGHLRWTIASPDHAIR